MWAQIIHVDVDVNVDVDIDSLEGVEITSVGLYIRRVRVICFVVSTFFTRLRLMRPSVLPNLSTSLHMPNNAKRPLCACCVWS